MRSRRAQQQAIAPPPKVEKYAKDEEYEDPMEEEEESEEEPVLNKSQQRTQMKSQLAPETKDKMRMNSELSMLIVERYNELLKDLALNDDSLEELNFTPEEKALINKKVELWLEYFISTATFRDDDVNLFDYLDSFVKTQKFL